MPAYGFFEDDELIAQYADEADAEDHKDRYLASTTGGKGACDVRLLCPDDEPHWSIPPHGLDDCPDTDLLQRVLDGLSKL